MQSKLVLIPLLLALCPPPAAAGRTEDLRARFNFDLLLTEELHKAVLEVPGGKELSDEIAAAGGKLPRFDMQDFGGDGGNARFYGPLETVVFNRAKVLRRLGLRPGPDKSVPWRRLNADRPRLRSLARSLAPVFYHELVHLRQQRAGGFQLFPENEYEAFLLTDLCTHAMIKAEPALLEPFTRKGVFNGITPMKSRDAFLAAKVKSYFTVCAGKKAYFGGILSLYADKLPRDGDGSAATPDAARRAFADSVNREIAERWPAFWAEAALTIGRAAAAGGNYSLALFCLAPDRAEAGSYGLPPAALKAVSEEAEKTLAAAEAAFLGGENGDFDQAAQDFLALERAYRALGRPLPERLAKARSGVYARGRGFYSARLKAEKDPGWREYYGDNLKLFSSGGDTP